MAEWLGWHFLREGGLTRNGQRVAVGQTLTVAPPLQLCSWGLHASRRALDALQYAPGPIACRVRLSGEILEVNDKACATKRTVLAIVDATRLLHEFACDVAEQALLRERGAGREPDERSWAAIAAKRAWLRGEISDEELAAARTAAWSAARAAASDDARVAALDAARVAARVAALDATRYAASAAAWEAAWFAAWDAAWEAARDAARDAALAKMNADLERRLLEAMGLPVEVSA